MLINGEKTHNVIEKSLNDNTMTMKWCRKSKLCSDNEAESGAERYIRLLNAPECRQFFIKVMYHLPYDTRENILAMARRSSVRSPKKYFTYVAKRELARFGF